ncbi:EAL domain-containing protein [Achromobacter insuavis]|uniref:EAL domain-containing protein n=1 Tax=Achromobacter insuavis TaxID=1287735 RepID=UPI003B9C22BB
MNRSRIILIFDNEFAKQGISDSLEQIGFVLNPVSLQEPAPARHAGEIQVHLCLPRDLDITIGQLRARFSHSTIIAIRHIESPAVRINALLAGADSCYGTRISYSEVAAAIQSAQRKLTLCQPAAAAAPRRPDVAAEPVVAEQSWRLCDNDWTLVSPAGPGVSLTPMERAVLKGMYGHPERIIRRADFAAASLDIPGNGRALDLVISRLKRKGVAAGMTIPIRSLRGKGYSFSATLAQDGSEPAAVRKEGAVSPLLAAIQGDRLQFHYQPIVTATDLEIVGAEALLRWRATGGETMGIDGLLREAGAPEAGQALISWGLHTIAHDQARWRQEAPGKGLAVNINISPQSFARRDVVGVILRDVAACGLAPDDIRIELTEEAALHAGSAEIRSMLEAFTSRGIQVWLDDFGKGYNNLEWLSALPLAGLKLDKSIIWSAARQADAQKVLTSICQLARDLDIATVAEGIETEAHCRAAREAGCDLLQGFLFFRPGTGDELAAALAEQRWRRAGMARGRERLTPAVARPADTPIAACAPYRSTP